MLLLTWYSWHEIMPIDVINALTKHPCCKIKIGGVQLTGIRIFIIRKFIIVTQCDQDNA